MGTKSKLTPREVMELERARHLEQATAIERDLAEYDRIAAKYNLSPSSPRTKAAEENVTLKESPKPQKNKNNAGNVAWLVTAYRSDERSPYLKLRYKTREHYDVLIKRILADCGKHKLSDLKLTSIQHLYEGWSEGGKTAMGRALITMLRSLVYFGATTLEDSDCERISIALRRMRFAVVKTRNARLMAEQVKAICIAAHNMEHYSIALAQAFQFDCKLRQKDVVGEWVPESEADWSDTFDLDMKWLRGLRWEEIDANLILTHIQSKSQKEVIIDLKLAPMVMEEFVLMFGEADRKRMPETGPVIKAEGTGLPWRAIEFRRNWRAIANAAGVPKEVRNMDSRGGVPDDAANAKAVTNDGEPKLRIVK